MGPSVSLRDTFIDARKAIVAVHLNFLDAITVAPEMYNAPRRKIVIGLIVDSLAMCA
jgi:hypothetical protein